MEGSKRSKSEHIEGHDWDTGTAVFAAVFGFARGIVVASDSRISAPMYANFSYRDGYPSKMRQIIIGRIGVAAAGSRPLADIVFCELQSEMNKLSFQKRSEVTVSDVAHKAGVCMRKNKKHGQTVSLLVMGFDLDNNLEPEESSAQIIKIQHKGPKEDGRVFTIGSGIEFMAEGLTLLNEHLLSPKYIENVARRMIKLAKSDDIRCGGPTQVTIFDGYGGFIRYVDGASVEQLNLQKGEYEFYEGYGLHEKRIEHMCRDGINIQINNKGQLEGHGGSNEESDHDPDNTGDADEHRGV